MFGLGKCANVANLPHGWSVLYYLAQLGRRDLERMILEGAVHPRLKLREAKLSCSDREEA